MTYTSANLMAVGTDAPDQAGNIIMGIADLPQLRKDLTNDYGN